MGRYGASELMRNKNLQKKAVNYGIKKFSPFIEQTVGSAMDELSTKVRHLCPEMHAVAKMANLTKFCQGFWRMRRIW